MTESSLGDLAAQVVASPAPLPGPLWQSLISLGEPRTLDPSDRVLEQGQPPAGLFLLEQGTLEVDLAMGARLALPAATVVGEMSFLSGQPARARVSCREACQLRHIAAERLWGWVAQHPEPGRELLQALASLAMQRLQGQFHQNGYLALVAHDGRKPDLLRVAGEWVDLLHTRPLLTTAHTGALLEQQLGLRISRRVSSGPLGGDQELGSLVVAGLVEAVLFFPDPLNSQPHSADVAALLRVCDVCGVPLATNPGSARLLLQALARPETQPSTRQL